MKATIYRTFNSTYFAVIEKRSGKTLKTNYFANKKNLKNKLKSFFKKIKIKYDV